MYVKTIYLYGLNIPFKVILLPNVYKMTHFVNIVFYKKSEMCESFRFYFEVVFLF